MKIRLEAKDLHRVAGACTRYLDTLIHQELLGAAPGPDGGAPGSQALISALINLGKSLDFLRSAAERAEKQG